MAERPICEVCGKPEAGAADRSRYVEGLCWAPLFGGEHAPDEIRAVLREAVQERDRLRALLAAYGRAVEERREDVAVDTLLDLLDIEDEAAKWREWG